MKYYEIIRLYRQGKLNKEESRKVSEEIEKHEAISEYLFQCEEYDVLYEDESNNKREKIYNKENRKESVNSDMEEARQFTVRINNAVRKAFIRMGIITGSIVFLLVICVIFIIPQAVDLFYYNPGETAGQTDAFTTNRMSLDMAVFTEIWMPGDYIYDVYVEGRGYGNYNFQFNSPEKFNYYTKDFRYLDGVIMKGRIGLFNSEYLGLPDQHVFGWNGKNVVSGLSLSEQMEPSNLIGIGPVSKEESMNCLEQLEDGQKYRAYVSLENILEYDEFITFINSFSGLQKIWCAPCIAEPDNGEQKLNVGFYYDAGVSFSMEWDREKYTDLVLWGNNDGFSTEEYKEITGTEEKAEKHFMTMLSYMEKQEQFLSMLGQSPEIYGRAAEYIDENGLKVYGFYCEAYKDTLLEMNRQTEVCIINSEKMEQTL